MKILAIIFCLFPSVIINAQIIDYNSFNDKIINEVMFNKINEYISIKGGYSLSRSSEEHRRIYKCIKRNDEKLLLDDLSSEINELITASSVGILDSISVKEITTYQEVANKCITDLANSSSDAFFMIGWGKVAEVTTYYNKRSKTVYISVVYQN